MQPLDALLLFIINIAEIHRFKMLFQNGNAHIVALERCACCIHTNTDILKKKLDW